MKLSWSLGAALVIASGLAAAQAARRLDVAVGQKREVEVGTKIGVACDDTSLIETRMETRGDRNWFVIKGVAVGTTLCRVGTDPSLPSELFEVVVTAAKTKRVR